MQRYSADCLLTMTTDIFVKRGAPRDEAAIVAEQLVAANLVGMDSHGVVRIPLYNKWIDVGPIKPGAPITVNYGPGATAVVDCGYNFGQVGALRAIEVAIRIAKEYKLSCVVTRRCCHVGRLGYFTEMAAKEGLFALATVNSAKKGHTVVPFGGLEGRMAPNPISYAVPGPDHALVADMSMSTSSEGKIRVYRNRGETLPEGWIVDANGKPSINPDDFYGPPRGWLLPVGASLGYKGYAFLLLAEILSGSLAGIAINADIPDGSNGVCFILIDISAFTPVDEFRELIGDMTTYVKSAPPAPGTKEVLMPGEVDLGFKAERQANGIPIDPSTWRQIQEVADVLEVPVPRPL